MTLPKITKLYLLMAGNSVLHRPSSPSLIAYAINVNFHVLAQMSMVMIQTSTTFIDILFHLYFIFVHKTKSTVRKLGNVLKILHQKAPNCCKLLVTIPWRYFCGDYGLIRHVTICLC